LSAFGLANAACTLKMAALVFRLSACIIDLEGSRRLRTLLISAEQESII